jgi:hypothetical protein
MATVINTVNDFKHLVGSSDFAVTFRKANGQFRRAEGNLAAVKALVKRKGNEQAAETREDRGIVVFYEHEKKAIRSFALDTMSRLEVGGQVYQFGL